jgi:hypothetical protein
MIGIVPRAVYVGKLYEAIGVFCDALGDVVIIVGVVLNAGADQDGFVYLVAIHLPEQLFDDAAAFGVWYGGLVGPAPPGVCVRIDNHISRFFPCATIIVSKQGQKLRANGIIFQKYVVAMRRGE